MSDPAQIQKNYMHQRPVSENDARLKPAATSGGWEMLVCVIWIFIVVAWEIVFMFLMHQKRACESDWKVRHAVRCL